MSGAPAKPMSATSSGELAAHDAQGVADERRDLVPQFEPVDRRARSQRLRDRRPRRERDLDAQASSGVMMSLKMMAASSAKRFSGCKVISAAIAGSRVISRNEERALIARYSGK